MNVEPAPGSGFLMKKTIGAVFVITPVIFFVIDRVGAGISSAVARIYCADSYMQPVNGVVADLPCGFNAGMYFFVFLFIIFLIGVKLFFRRSSH